jgi:SAM-dependent methyltransferase
VAKSPVVFDRALLRARRRRAHRTGAATFLLDHVAQELAERLSAVMRRFALAADFGTPGDAVRRSLVGKGLVERIITVDALAKGPIQDWTIAADEEALPLANGSLDLAVSALSLQYVNDLPGALVQIRRALKPDGLFLGVLPGGDTLTELRASFTQAELEVEGGVSPRVAPFADLRDLGALLQRAGFALPVTDVDRLTIRYDTPLALMRDLRRMGATSALSERRRTPLRRATLSRMTEVYVEKFSDSDGRVRATFEMVWLSGWAPDASQQQPLKPGSARMRLSDALGTKEVPAGEKAPR